MRQLTQFVTGMAVTLFVTASVTARAAEPPCLSPGEFTSLAGYALPSIINGTNQRCSIVLPADAWLPKNGNRLAGRYAQGKSASWPGAKAAFLKLSSSTNSDANALLRDMPDGSLQQILDATMEGMVSQTIKPERCTMIDKVVRLLSPLPPENASELIAVLVGLKSKSSDTTLGKIRICKN